MALNWYPMDIVVALHNTEEWVARHGTEFEERIRAMPWRNISICDHYAISAELLVENGMAARREMTQGVERCLPDGGQGVFWLGQDRPWR